MKKPPYLKKGDKILAVAPSFGVTTSPYEPRYEQAVKNLKRFGYIIEEGANVHLAEGVVASASPEQRGREIMDGLRGDASLLLSVGGGELMDEMLPYIDFEEIKSLPPKWFMGFSDNTNLTYTLTTLCDWQTIYGPCCPSFYEKPFRLNQLDALKMLEGEKEFVGYPKWNKPNFRKKKPLNPAPIDPLRRGRYMTVKVIKDFGYSSPFSGTMLGGCLDCLVSLCGTRFDKTKEFIAKHDEGIVWYLEACDLSPVGIRRALFQLRESGWFANAKGFLIGRPLCWDQSFLGLDRFEAVLGALKEFNVPILMDIDLGHYPPSLPMLNGEFATISLTDGNIKIVYR